MLNLTSMAEQFGLENWIDVLYRAEFNPEHRSFMLKVASVTAAIELAKTTPLNEAYQQKLLLISEVAFYRGMEALKDWAN
jgi:hypothetical protein